MYKALHSANLEHHPLAEGGRVEEDKEIADVGPDVLEGGDGVKGELVVGLGRLEERRVDAEGIGGAAGAPDPDYGCCHQLFSGEPPPHQSTGRKPKRDGSSIRVAIRGGGRGASKGN